MSTSRNGAFDGEKRVAIKFLVPNNVAGGIIGSGGKCIKELIDLSKARVNVSGVSDHYPGTNDRVVLVAGTVKAVAVAQTLIWELLAQLAKAGTTNTKEVTWNPKETFESLGNNDDASVSARISIPAAASGQILGKSGATIRSITEDSGAKVGMTSKEESLFTQERIITIAGTTNQCVKATDLIITKLGEQREVPPFANRGTLYSSPLDTSFGIGGGPAGPRRRGTGSPRSESPPKEETTDTKVSDTTITLSIPDDLVGNIFGKQGSTMREIISLSGATVTVSPRNEFVEGTNNRLVTITGTPAAAQTAHIFITQRLRNPTNPPRRPRKVAA